MTRSEGKRPIYSVQIKDSAKKEIAALPTDVLRRVSDRIDELALDPRPSGCEKLRGAEDTYRLRVGDYRILYEVHDNGVQRLGRDDAAPSMAELPELAPQAADLFVQLDTRS